MRIAFPSDDNQFLMPTQQRSYTRVTSSAPIIVRSVTGLEMVGILPDLVELFTETVNNGSPLGFLAPITHTTARSYWVSLIPELEAGSGSCWSRSTEIRSWAPASLRSLNVTTHRTGPSCRNCSWVCRRGAGASGER